MDIVICNHCGRAAELVTGLTMYPRRPDLANKKFYKCFPCKAWVGCHPDTETPMGTLADEETRKWRGLAHIAFDKRWNYPGAKTSRSRRRGKAYRWLAHRMGLTKDECHIGSFNVDQCRQAADICKAKKKGGASVSGTRAAIRRRVGEA